MRWLRAEAAFLAVLLAGALCALPSQACRRSDTPVDHPPDTALLLGVVTGEYVDVSPGEVIYYDRSSLYPEQSMVPVRGYVVRVQAFHHPKSSGLAGVFAGSDSKAILVPWGHRGDCRTRRWDEAAGRWISSPEPAVYTAVLRQVAAPDGTPIFDVYSAYFEPYPTAKLIRDRISEVIRGGQRFLTAQEFFIFSAVLPVRDPDSGETLDPGRTDEWAKEYPELAKRWPAVETLESLRARGQP